MITPLERRLRLLLLAVPLFAIGSAVEVGCVGGADDFATEQPAGQRGGSGYGGYGYGYRARSSATPDE